ncbi:MAG: rRNA adenine N-6-methyltransferase family protein [Rickettsiales bacterium]|jgi:phosphatidylethanolamine/phosphatidyl-N-methylethanolamine N-methyltransferase
MPQRIDTAKSSHKQRRLRHHFIAAWLRSPLKMGAALPSSRSLARAMVAQIDMSRAGSIIELGAGTGMMTQALLEADVPRDRLLVIERDKKLHALLHAVFHDLKVLCADAMNLDKVLKEHDMQNVNAIVSSLPFITMPVAVAHSIQEQMANAIGKDGMIVQFTYGTKSPIKDRELKRFGLVGKRVKLVLINVPPAHVWVYRQK